MNSARVFPQERTVVITGAASERGIGRALAHRMASHGWGTAVVDIDEAGVQRLAEKLGQSYDVPCIGIGVDVADESSVDRALSRVESELPPVLGLANVAGVSSPVSFLDLTAEEWDRVFAINSRGVYLMTRRLVPGMVSRGLGRVVTVSSASAQRGGGTYSKVAYSASKAAVLGMTRALAREVGIHGVTVNAVSPGPIDTDIMGGRLSQERKAEIISDLVVDRLGTVDDVAAVIDFLMSEDAGYISGATYNVNGGLIID